MEHSPSAINGAEQMLHFTQCAMNEGGMAHRKGCATRTEARFRYRRLLSHLAGKSSPLLRQLETSARGIEGKSLACPIRTNRIQTHLSNQLIHHVERPPGRRARLYTFVCSKWIIAGTELTNLRPRKILRSVRTLLNNAGFPAVQGDWIMLCFDNEYDPSRDEYVPHIHAICVAEDFRPIESLRALKIFKGGSSNRIYRPIHFTEIEHARSALNYALKIRWHSRASTLRMHTASTLRTNKRGRIPDPRFVEMLIFLDRQKIGDLIIFIGLNLNRKKQV